MIIIYDSPGNLVARCADCLNTIDPDVLRYQAIQAIRYFKSIYNILCSTRLMILNKLKQTLRSSHARHHLGLRRGSSNVRRTDNSQVP